MMSPKRRFFLTLGLGAMIWTGLCIIFYWGKDLELIRFLCLFGLSLTDLAALLAMAWILFYSKMTKSVNTLILFILFTFKLVCLGFLAITLKRLGNATGTDLVLGVGFVGVGPLFSAFFAKDKQHGKFI